MNVQHKRKINDENRTFNSYEEMNIQLLLTDEKKLNV